VDKALVIWAFAKLEINLSKSRKNEMSTNRTFTIIKPDAVLDGFTGPIIQQIEEAGYKIIALKKIHLSAEEAGAFYAVHKDRPFYGELCDFISSNSIIPMVLEKENAVEDFRTLIGATDPSKAAEGTIRKRFARSLSSNAIHGSDSDENAAIEGAFFFTATELK
jgi:nucleoside-diphosphate kinase